MRLHHLLEATINSDLLGELADYIIRKLPTVRSGTSATVSFSWDDDERFVEMGKRFPEKYRDAFRFLKDMKIVVDNETITSAAGAFSAQNRNMTSAIYLFLKTITGSDEGDYTNPQNMARRPDGSIRSVKSTLVHELRHYLQRTTFSKYYFNRDDSDYHTDPMEIDAAWFHHIEEHNPTDFDSAKEYADEVMKRFAAYKRLTPEQVRHYYRKAATYWLERMSGPVTPMGDPKSRAAERKAAMFNAAANLINGDASNMRDAVPGYSMDAVSFYIPDNWRPVLRKAISGGKPLTHGNESIAYLLMALGNSADLSVGRKALETLSGHSFDETLSSLPFPADKFDVAAIERLIRNRFA